MLDLASARSGSRLFHIRNDEVRTPFGVEVTQVLPATLAIDLEKSTRRTVPVKPALEGDVAGNRLTALFKRVAQRTRTSGGVRIGGIDDVLVRYGKCCGPVPGDPIVGFITRGRGVTVHVRGCKKAMESDPDRRVDVSWDVQGEFKRSVSLTVKSDDTKGLLAKMSETFAGLGVNIIHADARATSDKRGAISSFEIEIKDAKQLSDVVKAIGDIKGVHSVERA